MPEGAPLATTERLAPRSGLPTWAKGIAPLVVLVLLVAMFVRIGPVGVFRNAFPPVEQLTVERITLPRAGEMRVRVVNGGPAPVTIAQVLVATRGSSVWHDAKSGFRIPGCGASPMR
jgi:hypothetical protein